MAPSVGHGEQRLGRRVSFLNTDQWWDAKRQLRNLIGRSVASLTLTSTDPKDLDQQARIRDGDRFHRFAK
jgi:hypothetical protein